MGTTSNHHAPYVLEMCIRDRRGDDLVTSAVSCMKKVCDELGDRAKNIAAIAFTGQMSGFMGVDHEWNDITTWSCSLDSRYMPYAQRQMKELKREFLQTSGTNAPQMAPKFEWFKDVYKRQSRDTAGAGPAEPGGTRKRL